MKQAWERLMQSREGTLFDHDLQQAALNLLEDAELARRSEEEQAVGRERAEAAERASEARLQLAVNAAEMGTFIWYPQEDRGESDERNVALFGLRRGEELNCARTGDLMPPEDRAEHLAAV